MSLVIAGCGTPSRRENVQATADLVATQTAIGFDWRRNDNADAAARSQVETLLSNGIALDECVSIAYLASPDIQLALEKLEIARADLVAASTLPNPVAIVGVRDPGGNLAVFYPDRNISLGVMQNVLALLNMPDRRAIARHELRRAQLEGANQITSVAVLSTQAWFEYAAAMRVQALRIRAAAAGRAALDTIIVQAANGSGWTALNVAEERNSLFAAQGAVVRAGVEVSTARAKLAQMLGLSGWHDDWTLSDELPALPAADPELASSEKEMLQRRFDIQAAAKSVDARLRVLATQRRFRWLGELEIGMFREKAVGGTAFTGPNAVVDIPLFDQHKSQILAADSELRTATRNLEAVKLAALTELRTHAAEMQATRALLEQYEHDVLPNHRQILAQLATNEPGNTERLRLRLSSLAAEEEQVGLLRDYWRARSAFALSAGAWASANGLAPR
jgi:outer membrane protein, heavy metal efflux system